MPLRAGDGSFGGGGHSLLFSNNPKYNDLLVSGFFIIDFHIGVPMKNHTLYAALVVVGFLLVFGAWILAFFNLSVPAGRVSLQEPAKAEEIGMSGKALFNPPRPEDAPESIRAEVMLGYKMMTETRRYAGEYINNDLSCSSCHFDGGRSHEGISLVGVGATYPRYRSRQAYTADLAMRTQGCFDRSMNGKAPPLDSQVMQSLLVYMQWISKGVPIYADLPWALPKDLGNSHKPDMANGRKVYEDVCATCHGQDGQGTRIAPPLWGDGSYNDGAGMHGIPMFSVFAWRFMPKSAPSLSKEQALDVAGFVHEQPRPHFVADHSEKIVRTIPLEGGSQP